MSSRIKRVMDRVKLIMRPLSRTWTTPMDANKKNTILALVFTICLSVLFVSLSFWDAGKLPKEWPYSANVYLTGTLEVTHTVVEDMSYLMGVYVVKTFTLKTKHNEYILRIFQNTKCDRLASNDESFCLIGDEQKESMLISSGTACKVEGILLRKAVSQWKKIHSSDTNKDALSALLSKLLPRRSSSDHVYTTSDLLNTGLRDIYIDELTTELSNNKLKEIILVQRIAPI